MGQFKSKMIDMQQSEYESRLASALGISQNDLDRLDYEIETDTGDDGTLYNYRIEFHDSSPKKILHKIKRLESGCRVTLSLWELEEYDDYEQSDYDEQYDAIVSEKNYLQKFLNEMDNLSHLNELPVDNLSLNLILKRQIFISAIGALETFLSDTFISLTFENDEYFKNFIETHPEFKQRKFELKDIFFQMENIRETAKKVMIDTIYHNLPVVRSMFTATFKTPFPTIKTMNKLVLTRHDLVHRNGRTKDGEVVLINKKSIEDLINDVTSFVEEISSSISAARLGIYDDGLPF